MVAVSVQETTADDVAAYAERYSLPYTIGFDATSAVFRTYQGFGLPTHVFIDADGVIRHLRYGPLDRERGRPPSWSRCWPAEPPRRSARSGSALARRLADRRAGAARARGRSIQPSSAASAKSAALTSTLVSGKSSKAVTHFGLADQGRMQRSPMKATVRSRPRTMMAWWPPLWPPVRRTSTPGMSSSSPSADPGRAQGSARRSSSCS